MGNVNFGSQTLSFDFQQEAKSQTFNTLNLKLTPLGLYEGFNLVKISDSIVRVERDSSTLKSICYISDSVANVGVRVELAANVDLSVSSGNLQHYIVARMVWVNTDLNYMDILAVEHQEPRNTLDPLKLFPDDLIIGKLVYDGSTLRSSFDLTRRDNFYLKNTQTLASYLKVYPQPKTIDNTIYISSGQLRAPTGLLTINSSNKTITNLTSTSVGRNDIVWVDRNGLIQVTYGTETGGTPVTPPYGDKKVLAEIRRNPGRPVDKITGDQIVNVLTDYNIVPGTQDLLLATQTSFSGTDTVDTAFQKIATGTFTFNGDKTFSGTTVFQKSITITGSSGLDILTLNAFGGSNLLKVDSTGKLISVSGKIDLQHATSNIFNVTNSASSLLVQFGGVNKLTLDSLNTVFYTNINLNSGNFSINGGLTNSSSRPTVSTGSTGSTIHAYSSNGLANDDGFLRLSAGGGSTATTKSFIDISGYSVNPDMDRNIVFGPGGVEGVRITLGGSVGIGTKTPFTKLTLPGFVGGAAGSQISWNYTTGQSASRRWWIGSDLNVFGDFGIATETVQGSSIFDTYRLYVSPAGRVGLGTVIPNELLDVNGAIQFRGSSVGYGTTQNVGMIDFDTGSNGSRILSFGPNSSTRGVFTVYQAAQNNALGLVSLQIDSSGRTLLRSDTAGQQNTVLSLVHDTTIGQSSAMTVDIDFFLRDGNTRLNVPQARIGIVGDSTANQDYEAGGTLVFYTAIRNYAAPSLVARAWLNPLGYFGLGTSTPSVLFEALDSSSEQMHLASSLGGYLFAGFNGAGQYARIGAYSSGWKPLILNEGGGSVSIGTLRTDSPLNVGGSLQLEGIGLKVFYSYNRAGGVYQPLQMEGSYVTLAPNGVESFRAIAGGNVGIATTTPLSKLHVNGNLTLGANTSSAGVAGMVQLLSDQASPYSGKLVFGTDDTGWKFGISKNVAGTITNILTVNDDGNISFIGNTLSFGPGAGGIIKAGNATLTLTVPSTSSLSVPTAGTILTDSAVSSLITGSKTFNYRTLQIAGSNASGDYDIVRFDFVGTGVGTTGTITVPAIANASQFMTVSQNPTYLNHIALGTQPGGFQLGLGLNMLVTGALTFETAFISVGGQITTPSAAGVYQGVVITSAQTVTFSGLQNTPVFTSTASGIVVIWWSKVS